MNPFRPLSPTLTDGNSITALLKTLVVSLLWLFVSTAELRASHEIIWSARVQPEADLERPDGYISLEELKSLVDPGRREDIIRGLDQVKVIA